ncbi:MAG TPA: PH domain-containing protein, partial [Acidimicrobiales bacterium]|nr:PH domain-containing protein [Acidimicrobiales bacterium]
MKSPDGPSGGWAAAQPTVVWHRLHPLTPAVGGGRSIILMAVITTEQAVLKQPFSDTPLLIVLGALALTAVLTGTVKYMVTRWALDGPTLRIETGLLRRDARKLPLARIQAVDVVKPFLARTMGLAELRVRLAGSGRAGGRLAYLSEP